MAGRPLKVRWWPFDVNPRIASTRIRCMPVMAALRAHGIDAAFYREDEAPPDVLVLAKRYDAQTMAVAQELRARGTRVLLDLCDNHFYAEHDSPAARQRRDALCSAVRRVDAVIASTPTLAEQVREAVPEAPAISVIGDAFEAPREAGLLERLREPRAELRLWRLKHALTRQDRGALRLLWFGQHGSQHASGGMLDLQRVMPLLRRIAAQAPLSLTVISNNAQKFAEIQQSAGFAMHYLPWHLQTFSRATRLHEVALIPIGLNPFTVCKTNNRLATALLHGLDVIADPIPAYEEFGGVVFLGDWEAALQRVLQDRTGRAARVATGQARLQAAWSLEQIAHQWQQGLSTMPDRSKA
jgi:hypothetical protein